MAIRPYMTSKDLIAAVKRKIAMPISQNTYSETDILAFANEEMAISQVPSVMIYHQEYFAYKVVTPLVQNISRYPIPDRAIGMRLRDLMWSDTDGNFFEMARISADDKAYFQRNVGSNQAIHKFYLEGNDVVLTPSLLGSTTGNLNFFIYLRPNQLVDDTRACTIESFCKDITVSYSDLVVGDTLSITVGNNSASPSEYILTCSNNSITSSSVADPSEITMSAPHGKDIGSTFQVTISEHSGSVPSINSTYTATATGASTFTIPVNVTTGGTGGKVAYVDEFSIGSSSLQTASNLATAINDSMGSTMANNNSSAIVNFDYTDISTSFEIDSDGLSLDNDNVYINFDQLPTTWTDPATNVTEDLFQVDGLVDFLQTKAGHKTHTYDVTLEAISGTQGKFAVSQLKYYASNGTGGQLKFLPIVVGDYMCVANECIIPQIPSDLHNGLAERTAARILAALGDQEGLAASQAKIAEIDSKQGTLLDSRVDGSVMKVTQRKSQLAFLKQSNRRRI